MYTFNERLEMHAYFPLIVFIFRQIVHVYIVAGLT